MNAIARRAELAPRWQLCDEFRRNARARKLRSAIARSHLLVANRPNGGILKLGRGRCVMTYSPLLQPTLTP